VVLSAISLPSYGLDTGTNLVELVEKCAQVPGIERIRLGSLDPDMLTPEFISRLAAVDKLCPQFHLSLQSGCTATLRRMRRVYTAQEYAQVVEQIRAELDALVGLAPVKEYVFGLADNLQVQQRRAAAGFKTASLSMHMIFTGNPGTGKTTIARLVAKYLKAIGALGGGQLVEVTRADLVGRYTGHTAPLTNSVIESALGGVLFIDEAYSLYRGQQDSFGLEAIDTLVKGMEDHRDELVVILAGYTKEMEVFLTANSGLASRFPNKIEFPDYTADELLDITAVLAKGKGYRLAEGCTFPLLGYYKRRQALDSRTAGNGRLARNTLEKAIFNQSRRLIAEPAAELDLIQPSDLEFEE